VGVGLGVGLDVGAGVGGGVGVGVGGGREGYRELGPAGQLWSAALSIVRARCIPWDRAGLGDKLGGLRDIVRSVWSAASKTQPARDDDAHVTSQHSAGAMPAADPHGRTFERTNAASSHCGTKTNTPAKGAIERDTQ
jgi:hypothetical protein